MYDLDILDEAAIIEWGDSKPSKKFVAKELSAALKEKAKKLVEWLKTADTDSSSEVESSKPPKVAFFFNGSIVIYQLYRAC